MEVWRDLLGDDSLARLIVREAKEDFHAAATRIWCALECVKKAGVGPRTPLTLSAIESDGWVVLGAGGRAIATGRVMLAARPAIAAVLVEREEPCAHMNTGT